ncbi:MAG: oligosaccharide flippase family protein [Nitrospirae bacterium]|nr:oligosaccharide flippase family protein [Nitrospirota bacterium]
MNPVDIKRSIQWNTVLLVAVSVLNLATNIFLVRTLSIGEYAVYIILISFKNTIAGMSDFGVSTSYTKYFHQIAHDYGISSSMLFTYHVLVIKVTILLVIIALIYVFNGIVLSYFKLDAVFIFNIALILIIIIVDSIANVFERYFEVNLKQKLLNIVKTVVSVLFVVSVYSFYWLDKIDAKNVLYSLLLVSCLKIIILAYYFYIENRCFYNKNTYRWLSESNIPRFIKNSVNIYLDKISTTLISTSFLIIIITPFFSKNDIAFLSLACDFVSKTLAFMLFPVNGLILPVFAHTYAYKQHDGLSDIYHRTVKYCGLLFAIMAGFIMINSQYIITILYTSRYAASIIYVNLLVPMLFAEQVVVLSTVPVFYVRETYKMYWINRAFIIFWVACFTLSVMQIKLSILSVLILYGLIKLLNIVSLSYYSHTINKMALPWRLYAKILFSICLSVTVAMASGGILYTSPLLLRSIVVTIVYGIALFVTIRVLNIFDYTDIELADKLKIPGLRVLFKGNNNP